VFFFDFLFFRPPHFATLEELLDSLSRIFLKRPESRHLPLGSDSPPRNRKKWAATSPFRFTYAAPVPSLARKICKLPRPMGVLTRLFPHPVDHLACIFYFLAPLALGPFLQALKAAFRPMTQSEPWASPLRRELGCRLNPLSALWFFS